MLQLGFNACCSAMSFKAVGDYLNKSTFLSLLILIAICRMFYFLILLESLLALCTPEKWG